MKNLVVTNKKIVVLVREKVRLTEKIVRLTSNFVRLTIETSLSDAVDCYYQCELTLPKINIGAKTVQPRYLVTVFDE